MKIMGKRLTGLFCALLVLLLSLSIVGCKGATTQGQQMEAQTPQIAVSPREVASGNVVLNNNLDQTVTIKNTGGGYLYVGSIAQAKPLAPPFSILNDNCSGSSLAPSATCTLQVRFTPTSQTSFSDSFDIPSNAGNENSVTVTVSGSGKAIRVAVNRVNTDQCASGVLGLLVSVTENNSALTGLATSNFQLLENDLPKTVNVSQAPTTSPISVAVVLDYSTSLQYWVSDLQSASTTFINSMNTTDEAAIVKFAQYPQVMQTFTTDKALLTTAINTAPSSIGNAEETYLYDSLWTIIDTVAARQNNRYIVLLSDGRDEDMNMVPDVSTHTLAQVVAHAAANDVAIFTVGLGAVNGDVMNQLANGTGGQYFPVSGTNQLSDIYPAIKNLLAGQYSVQYSTAIHGSSLVTLNVNSGSDQGVASLQIQGCP